VGLVSNEERFVWDIDDLQDILKYPDARNLVGASAILRRLLTDGECLLHKVSKGRDFKPRFTVAARDSPPEIPEFAKAHGISELKAFWTNPALDVRDGMPTKELGLDDFLREPVHRFGDGKITIKELINYVANVGGGVHQGKPRNRDNAPLIDATKDTIIINGRGYPLESIKHIAHITRNALYPLYLRVRA
jgi:hypothetical protein